ncbi:hypothetical protein E6C76_20895 [Pseudothauera nasutitermitis]|uniref:Integrase n=1 Tax=Pseudothauera nasutitermitis TaxID=2565930 RepID=A0A4S4API3_9RHOO|nr:tyrosine-type recombinase/integrase [Pseudothauera nasutitermitis]THF61536.1 hypothetical protein E6C76_20895 [Pseudothauera nasutitermitis]
MRFSQASARFLGHCRSAISLSKHTLRAYTGDLSDACRFLTPPQKRANEVGKEDLRRYIRHLREERQLKESSIKRRLATLKLLFRWMKDEEIIQQNPFDSLNERIRLPRRLPRALDRLQAGLLRKAVAAPNGTTGFDVLCQKTAIQLMLETGIRVGELSNIKIDDVSLADQTIAIHGKGNRQRIVYLLSPAFQHSLQRYIERRARIESASDKLFITRSGLDLTPPRIRKSLREISAAAGVQKHLTPHMLRHTCATHWLESGLDIRYVQRLLGHQSISTTEIYTHVTNQGLREALQRATGRRSDN